MMIQKSYDDSASLYLIPTPIGNLDDITVRALNTLKSVDFILCEDTRETGKLLKKYDINKKLVSCHEYNEDTVKEKVVKKLEEGYNIGLVTDQGTPIISDPGYIVSSEVIRNGFNVISLPGATAFVPALTSSGIAPSPFLFYGFLNSKSSRQKKELELLKDYKFTMIFYEAPHRLKSTLINMREVLGNRNISINREISKLYEEVIRGKIDDLVSLCDNLKGEFVIVVEGSSKKYSYDDLTIMNHVKMYLDDGLDEKEAIKKVARDRKVAKSDIYKEYHLNK